MKTVLGRRAGPRSPFCAPLWARKAVVCVLYLGDGARHQRVDGRTAYPPFSASGGGTRCITFHFNSCHPKCLKLLAKMLNDNIFAGQLRFRVERKNAAEGYEIKLAGKYCKKFLAWIGKCPVPGHAHKWGVRG